MSDEPGIPSEPITEPNATPEDTDQGGVKYHDRIRAEPDFAVGEVQQKDRYIGELHGTVNKLKPLEQYVDALDGSAERLIELAAMGNQIDTNPQLKQIVQDALNGVTPKVEQEPEEEIYDPEIKALDGRYKEQLTQQQQVIRDLQTRLDKTEAAGLKNALADNLDKALSVFEGHDEYLEEARSELQTTVQRLEKAAANGDRSAASQLDQLGGPMGAKTVEMMTNDIYRKFMNSQLEAAKNQPNGEVMRSKATDAPSMTRSALPTDTIAIKSGARVTSQLVAEVMGKAARGNGKDPATLFGQ